MEKKNFGITLIEILVAVAIMALILAIVIPATKPDHPPPRKIICMSNLRQIQLACLIYQDENNSFPSQQVWCDVLEPYYEDTEKLQCPSDKIGPCSYAMNENIPSDANELPDDLVLLFESAPGWNQTGGPDDIVTDRHGRPGANIAFADGHVEFVEAEEIPNLRWTVEEKNKK